MDNKKIIVTIERASDGFYSAYVEDTDSLPFGATGEGSTVEEAKRDFLNVVDSFVKEDGYKLPEGLEFVYTYDVASFLAYYSNILTQAGLSKLTGINPQQLSHYATGHRHPSAKTVEKIQKGLDKFANDILRMRLS